LVSEDDILHERLTLLDQYVSDLRQVQEVSFARYQGDVFLRRYVERTLHMAIEACLDIGRHLITRYQWRYPEDNRDVFQVLYEEGVIPADFLPTLVDMARFRNLLVHDYARIDDAIVYGILQRRLDDFGRYAQAIIGYVEQFR